MANEITLLICGNRVASTGYQDLVCINSPLSAAGEDFGYLTGQYGSADFFIRVSHLPDYIKYELRYNPSKVTSSDWRKNGRLGFIMTIKRGFRLAGGKSPYDLLISIKDLFVSNNMAVTDGVYRFKEGNYDALPFVSLISSHQVEAYGRYIPMSGLQDAYMVLSDDALLRAFLKDTQYRELSHYKSVCVAKSGSVPMPLDIAVPRVPVYTVTANGVECGTISGTAAFTRTITSSDRKKSDSLLSFTIAQLRNGETIPNVVSYAIDDSNEIIKLSVSFKDKLFRRTFRFAFPGLSPDVERHIRDSFRLVITAAGQAATTKKLILDSANKSTVELTGDEVEARMKVETNSGYDCEFQNNITYADDAEFIVYVRKEFAGIRLVDIPPTIANAASSLCVTITLKSGAQKTYNLDKNGQNPSIRSQRTPGFRVGTVDQIEKVVLSNVNMYRFHTITDCSQLRIEDGWLHIVTPTYDTVQHYNSHSDHSTVNGVARIFTIKEINRDFTAEFILRDSDDGDLRVIKGFKRPAEGSYTGKVELPSNKKILRLTFRAKGCEPVDREPHSDSAIMPDFKPLSFSSKFIAYIKRRQIISKLILFILALMIGCCIPAAFLGKDKLIKAICGKEKVTYTPAPGEAPAQQPGSESDTPTKTGNNKAPGGDDNNKQAQDVCKKYIKMCENATLPFNKVDELNTFVKDSKNAGLKDINKLKKYAGHYTQAKTMLDKAIKGDPQNRIKLGGNDAKKLNTFIEGINTLSEADFVLDLENQRKPNSVRDLLVLYNDWKNKKPEEPAKTEETKVEENAEKSSSDANKNKLKINS